MKEKVRAHVIISGRVQGVFFRMETMRTAEAMGIVGWVRNQRDGTVEAVFEGNQAQVEKMLSWCHEGPSHARVTHVKIDWEEYTDAFTGFEVTF